MPGRFDSFVILADMRTGSNALESRLAQAGRVDLGGELFNPLFIGTPGHDSAYGMTLSDRDADPAALLAAHRNAARGLPGFRLFSDHDPRALAQVLDDPRCAKVVLTRDTVDSYLSLEIARATGQWWLGDARDRRTRKIRFDRAGFMAYHAARQGYLSEIRHRLQVTGQAAFFIDFEEIGRDDVIGGLLAFIGAEPGMADRPARAGVRQNPWPRANRVENPGEMERALSELSLVDLHEAPEAGRLPGPGLRRWQGSAAMNLLYLPVPGADPAGISGALAAAGEVEDGFTQKSLRRWKRAHPGHRGFCVVRHPLSRAYEAFLDCALVPADSPAAGVRATLARSYGVLLPDEPAEAGFGPAERRAAFARFLEFLRLCLSGQSALRPDPLWLSQSLHVQAMAQVALPDAILRVEEIGSTASEGLVPGLGEVGFATDSELRDIHDPELEKAARRAYARDFMMFGFGPWQPPGARRGQAA